MDSLLAFIPGTTWSVSLFVAICGTVVLMFLGAAVYSDANRTRSARFFFRLITALTMYCLLIAAIVNSGWLDRYFIPMGPLFLGLTVLFAAALGLTPLGRTMSVGIPIGYLVGFQGFRFPLEIVLHNWASTKTIPETMTWTGSNWDIATGIAALLVCFGVAKRRWLAWSFNLVGIVLLINVGRVAVFSSPVPFGWHVDPPLELILYIPYAYIVPICVGGAALGHVLLTRKLLSEAKN